MGIYTQLFGFREPYQLLLDGNFLHVAQMTKMNTWTALPKLLQGEVKLFTTTCVLSELRALGQEFSDTVLEAKKLERRRCNHEKPIGAFECFKSVLGSDNKHKYGVATQDLNLRIALRKIPGTPLVYINNSVLLLEPPSIDTQKKAKELEVQKTLPKDIERKFIEKANPGLKLHVVAKEPQRTFKKKAKGPNPLSMKKKKKADQQSGKKNEASVSVSGSENMESR